MALKNCKECSKEIGGKVKICPNCGTDQRNWFGRHKFLSFFGFLFLLGVIGNIFGSPNNPSSSTKHSVNKVESIPTEIQSFKVGDTLKTDKFEITITSVKKKTEVGSEFLNSKPSEGGIYVVIQWKYKNITSEPISSFSNPTLEMYDLNGTKYNSDISASSYFATEIKLDRKILSNLNPGITVNDAQVFEISKDALKTSGWKIRVNADIDIWVNTGL